MYTIDRNNITLTRGDSLYAVVGMIDKSTGEAYTPQEGDVIRFGMKKSVRESTCIIEKIIPHDTLMLHIAPNDTSGLPVGNYVYDIELTYANGDRDTFINKMAFNIVEEVV